MPPESSFPASSPRVLVVATLAKDHREMTGAAAPFFARLGEEIGVQVEFADDAAPLTDHHLAGCAAVVQLNLAPFDMTAEQQAALQAFVERGGGWIGIHAAGLTGKQFRFGEKPYWQWFEDMMGGIAYSPHPAYQQGTVVLEDQTHPVTRHLPERFSLGCEWYEFSESPRGRVRVLAVADESSYRQNRPMGDHPMLWTNEDYRRALYIAFGHDSRTLAVPEYVTLLRDALRWAAL